MAAGAAAILALSAAAYFYLHRPPKLTAKDTIVLAEFENKTGDPVFDETLRQGLAVQLEQSPFLRLVSDEQHQTGTASHEPAGRDAAHSRDRPGDLRANRQRRGSGRLDRKPRKPVRLVAARQELPHRRRPRPGAGAGGKEGRSPECAEPNCDSDQDAAGRIAGHHPGALDTAGAGNHVVAGSSEGVQCGKNRHVTRVVVRPRSRISSTPSPSIRNSRWRMPISGSMSWNMGQTDLGAEEVRKAYELRDRVSDRERRYILMLYDRAGNRKPAEGVADSRIVGTDVSSRC